MADKIIDPKELNLENYKRMSMDIEVREIDVEKRTIKIRAATKNEVRGDVILPNAYDLKRYRKNPVIMWVHDYDIPPLGKALWTKTDDEGLLQLVEFAKTQFADEIFYLYTEKFLNAWSIGFRIRGWIERGSDKYNELKKQFKVKGDPDYLITSAELYETSACPIGADPDALSLKMESGELKSNALVQSLQRAIKPETEEPVENTEDESEERTEDTEAHADDSVNVALQVVQLTEQVNVLKDLVEKFNGQIDSLTDKIKLLTEEKPEPKAETVGISADEKNALFKNMIRGEISRSMGKVE